MTDGILEIDHVSKRIIEGEIERMEHAIALHQRREELRQACEALEIPTATRLPTMREICSLVADRYGLTVDDLIGQSRARHIAHPRQEAMYLMYEQRWAVSGNRRYSMPQIGRFLGGRDHTTVLHGYRKHTARLLAAAVAKAAPP
jgi:chromosomal replication initiator protein